MIFFVLSLHRALLILNREKLSKNGHENPASLTTGYDRKSKKINRKAFIFCFVGPLASMYYKKKISQTLFLDSVV